MKKIIIYIFSLVFILFCSVHIKIFAVISNQYNVLFDYMTTYIVNSESTIISNGNSIKYVETLDSKGTPTSLSITLGTNKKYDVEELPNNYNINSNEIEFTINCNYEIYELYLYDSFENEIITSRTNNIYADFLVDDTYLLKVILRGTGNLIDNRTYEMYQTECYYSFTIDTKKPTINGASIYMDGIYTNSTIHVLGVDELSGIKAVYMLEPNGSKYQNMGTSISLTLTKNGLFTFYALDNAGNRSSLYYIYNDITVPTGSIKSIKSQVINSEYTEEDFYYEGLDSHSKVGYMEYKTPSSTDFKIYNGQVISSNSESGIYQFRTIDKAGNISEISQINLLKKNSAVNIVNIENSNKVYLDWNNDDYTVTVNDQLYQKYNILSTEGKYEVKIVDKIGNISYFTFIISCYYEFTKIVDATCIEDGYTLYTCISCQKEIKRNYKTNGKHVYNIKVVQPTCTIKGGVLHYCIICDEQYLTDVVQPLDHNYITFLSVLPTCTTEGERTYCCEHCAYIKKEYVPPTEHRLKFLKEEKKDNQIIRYNTCILCEYVEEEYIGVNKNLVLSTINNISNTYSKYIIIILSITSIMWSLFIGVRIIIMSKNEENIIIKKILKNYIIGLVVIFIILVAVPNLMKGIIQNI